MNNLNPLQCFRFLRQVEQHAANHTVPAHASECASCAAWLRVTREHMVQLRSRPELPAELRSPAFFERILESVIDAAADSPVGVALGSSALGSSALGSSALGSSGVVLGQMDDVGLLLAPQIVSQLRRQEHAPEWLWQRTRSQIRSELRFHGRRRWLSRATAMAGAAAVCLAAVGLVWLARGTREPFDIVFVSLTEMPALDHPTAVLRNGLSK